jgi:hypothetical protein
VRDILQIRPDVVAVDGEVEILSPGSDEAAATVLRRFAITALMVHGTEGWRIRLLRAYRL